jgi:D-alanine-D-alanine ligase
MRTPPSLQGKTIAVLMGGPGSEREISLVSAASVSRALRTLEGVTVVDVDVKDANFTLPPDTDLAYNVIHGTFGEDGQLQEILEARGVPYTGAGSASSRVAFDKILTKERLSKAGVPTPECEYWRLKESEAPVMELPYVVKPPREGSSVGVHIIKKKEDLAAAREDVARYTEVAMVETFVEGKELTVGILGEQTFPVIHIAPRSGFYDMNNKYPWLNDAGGTDYICPADLPPDVTQQVQAAALQTHQSLGVEVYSRVDILLDAQNRPWVLELNTIPGMTESSLLPKGALATGIDFTELCVGIAEQSLNLTRPA